MSKYYGDFPKNQTVYIYFNTHKADGTPIDLSSGAIYVYKSSSDTQVNTGLSLTAPYDSITGLARVVVTTTDSWYGVGEDYAVYLSAGTVDSISVVGTVIGRFSIENRVGNLTKIMGSTLTETSTGYLKAAFVKLLDVATPVLTADAAGMNVIADALLDRNMGTGSDTNLRSVRNALRRLRNKCAVVTGAMTVYKENDSTEAWSAAVTSDAAANPITAVTPDE